MRFVLKSLRNCFLKGTIGGGYCISPFYHVLRDLRVVDADTKQI